MGTYGQRKEHTGCAWEQMGNDWKTCILCGNQWKCLGKLRFYILTDSKHKEDICFAWELVEHAGKHIGFVWDRWENTMEI